MILKQYFRLNLFLFSARPESKVAFMASCVPIGIRGDQQLALLFLELQSKDKTAASTNSIEALAYSHQDPFQPLFGIKCAIKSTFIFIYTK